MAVATLNLKSTTVDSEPSTINFDTFPTVDGYASYEIMHEEEELTSPGIDGRRWRTIYDQTQPLVVDAGNPAITAASNHSSACDLADKMRRAKGRFGVLVVASGGTRTIRINVHVTAVMPRVNPGPIVGPGISGNASVASAWVMDVLEDS